MLSVIKGDPVITEVNSPSLFVGQIGAAPESSEPERGSRAFDSYGSCLAL